ncbi:hypothetical protein BDN72DRAFT_954199 [Pluteus cervinus]|uniref:Uncharacterized protein n=1 Tax=Pluteus cervinus TaxID=181527 RepID=A0ACD3BEX0_9AGAR|nr:hypothetical protein BDN72DRAFT_954199 [Pluteus cervinus]
MPPGVDQTQGEDNEKSRSKKRQRRRHSPRRDAFGSTSGHGTQHPTQTHWSSKPIPTGPRANRTNDYHREDHNPLDQRQQQWRRTDAAVNATRAHQSETNGQLLDDSTRAGPSRSARPTDTDARSDRADVERPADIECKGIDSKVMGLFRAFSRTSFLALQSTATQQQDDRRLETLLGVFGSVSRISLTAAAAIKPLIEEATENNEGSKQKLERDMAAMRTIWDEIIDTCANDILRTVREQKDALGSSTTPRPVIDQPSTSQPLKRFHERGRLDAEERPQRKRPRMSSLDPDNGDNEGALEQLTSQINEQAQMLQQLSRDYDELKRTLQQRIFQERATHSPERQTHHRRSS